MKERSLIAFTLLSQIAAGAYCVLAALHAMAAAHFGVAEADQLIRPALVPILLCMLLALAGSVFHLGDLGNAWRAFSNVRSSWLSREILFALLFMMGILALAVLPGTGPMLAAARSGLAWMSAFFSLGMVWSMAAVYRLRTIPAWDTRATAVSFFATAALLGSLGAGTFLAWKAGAPAALQATALHLAVTVVAAMTALELALLAWQWRRKIPASERGISSRPSGIGGRGEIALLRMILMLGSAVFVCWFWWFPPWSSPGQAAWLAAFLTALASEVLGRMLFYEARTPGILR